MYPGAFGVHDMGGLDSDSANAPIPSDRPYAFWERRIHSLLIDLINQKHLSVDEFRRAVEALEPAQYKALTYYERWTAAITAILIERGTLTRHEVETSLGPVPTAEDSKVIFAVGDTVQVRAEDATRRWRKPHVRVPGYIHGCVGTVTELCGVFEDPAYVAFRYPAPPQPLYRVRFATDYGTLEADMFQPWLVKAAPSALENAPKPFVMKGESVSRKEESVMNHGDHSHDTREMIEKEAVRKECAPRPLEGLANSLVELCCAKGLTTRERLTSGVERLDSLGGVKGNGVRLLVRAWCDAGFKERLLQNAERAAAELGIQTSNYEAKGIGDDVSIHPGVKRYPHGHTVIKVVENTALVHNLVVCTLCSCYPTAMLGLAPDWYKSQSYRARAVRDPKSVLAEFGTVLPAGSSVRVHDSTAEMRYLVLPMRPKGTEGWDEDQLASILTRDCMIGVALPSTATAVKL